MSLESLYLVRPLPLLEDTPDPGTLLTSLLRHQSAQPLLPHLQPVPSLQALCLQAVCDVIVTSPQAVTQMMLESLPAPLVRLLSDVVYAEVAAEDVEDVLDAVVTRHSRMAWLRPDCSEEAVRQVARLLRRKAPELREVHFQTGVGQRETDAFLEEFTSPAHGSQTCLRVVAGRPSIDDPFRLLSACPGLTTLSCRTGVNFSLTDLKSSSLKELDLETNIPVDLKVLDDVLPHLETLRVATWYRCSGSRRPLLLAPVEARSTCCRRLRHLSVTGYNLGCSLQVALPSLEQMALLRCTLQLQHLFRHQSLQQLQLQNIDGEAGDGCLPGVKELDLHCQWGGRRRIDLATINASFPSVEKMTLRSDYYRLQKTETSEPRPWFPHLTHLSLLWLSEAFSPPYLLMSEPLPSLWHLTLRRQCRLFEDLLKNMCPRLETLDVHSTSAEEGRQVLPSVRRLTVRLCAGDDIWELCERLPGLQEVEIHLGYLDHALARGYRSVVEELSRRGVQVTVLEE